MATTVTGTQKGADDPIGATTAKHLNPEADSGPRYKILTVTPELAQQFLKTAREHARPIKSAIDTYAKAMAEGQWIFNGIPCIIGKSGQLLKGVQRMHACIKANTPFVTLLAENVDDAVLHTLDQHRRRSYATVLEGRGYRHAKTLAGTLSRLIRYHLNALDKPYFSIPWLEMDRALASNPTIPHSVIEALDSPAKLISDTLRAALFFLTSQDDKTALHRFFDAVTFPTKYSAGEPGVLIHQRIINERHSEYRSSPNQTFAVCIMAVNDTILGITNAKPYKWLPATSDRAPIPYPELLHATPIQLDASAGNASAPVILQASREETSDISVKTEMITPEIAKDYLKHNANNRRIIQSHIDTMVRDILDGAWQLNASPIVFSSQGRLLNGQHRLYACIASREPIVVTVVRGVADAAFDTYDLDAKSRVDTTGINLAHASDDRVVMAAAKMLDRHERLAQAAEVGEAPPSLQFRYSATEQRKILEAHPSLPAHCTYGRRSTHIAPASIMTYVSYRVTEESADDPELGQTFLTKLETGAELAAKAPLLKLRNRLMQRRHTMAGSADEIGEEIMQAWINFREKPN